MENNTEIQKRSPADLIQQAVAGGADLEKLKGLLDLQERWESNEARKAFHKAMSEFKANPPVIEKDKTVAFKDTKYMHASLANVVDKITKELSKYGLSASWRVKQDPMISVTCKVTHVLGHSEETTIVAAADTTGCKNSIQAIGSTITYLSRYTILAALGLAVDDASDDDAVSSTEDVVDEQQLIILNDYIAATKTDVPKFLKYMGIESLEKMHKSLYQKAITALKAKEQK